MSLRLQMLQVARRGALGLGESLSVVRSFAHTCVGGEGAGLDRDGRPDLYYTIFALAVLQVLDEEIPREALRSYLARFGDGEGLSFVHLGALARCWAVVGDPQESSVRGILKRLEIFRKRDGGYDGDGNTQHGTAYGGFVALGAFQDLLVHMPFPLGLVQSLKLLEAPGGGWANAPGIRLGSTNATAAAITLLHQLEMPVASAAGEWLLQQQHPAGGFLAMPAAPIPDLLSTATALHSLACLEIELESAAKERTLDFLDSLWSAEGGFHGHWADDHLDIEYTFYGLLALGHLL